MILRNACARIHKCRINRRKLLIVVIFTQCLKFRQYFIHTKYFNVKVAISYWLYWWFWIPLFHHYFMHMKYFKGMPYKCLAMTKIFYPQKIKISSEEKLSHSYYKSNKNKKTCKTYFLYNKWFIHIRHKFRIKSW